MPPRLSNFDPEWLEQQFLRWQADPNCVPTDLDNLFSGFVIGEDGQPDPSGEQAVKQAGVQSLIYRYRDIGHLQAHTDPLNPPPGPHPLLALENFGLEEEDLDRSFVTRDLFTEPATLRQILDKLQNTYCRTMAIEFMHIQDPAEREWLKQQMEPFDNRPEFSRAERLSIMQKLQEASLFELFLHRKFLGQKRFSLEGGEVMIPLLEHLVRQAAATGMRDLVLGMAHRGRLNVLATIFGKPFATIFAEFADNIEMAFVGDGDVKYHKGYSSDRQFPGGHNLHLSISPNPSHLEAVNPVVLGKCRARHSNYGPGGKQRVVPVLIHGDAAFAGQGMVTETLNLSQLDGYQVGGTIHIVLNNQIGFTTAPAQARSTQYATDVAKMLMVPIFHVNGEDPEAAVFAATLALNYRQKFGKDAVIEILCFRRQGHNEGDEPAFTQPLMYDKIRQCQPVHEVYAETLQQAGVSAEEIERQADVINQRLEAALAHPVAEPEHGYLGKWRNVARDYARPSVMTGTDGKTLQSLATRLTSLPENFNAHPKIAKLLEKRRETVLSGSEIDWGTAEALAFATLLVEGVPIRLSGEDSRRGTFNHRHAVLVDQKSGRLHMPLAFLAKGQATMQVFDSMLSENAVLGFDFGFSLDMPAGLTIWEAQFGDFANGAQVIIDQFIASSGTKWDRTSGLVMFLPHGYEGQGAEHSSARIERYLQLCAENNMQVAYPSTPAQMFHLLRRQVKVPWRRPLVIFTPKSLLRLPACRSRLSDFCHHGFREILPLETEPGRVRTVLLCSGKIYYELLERKQADQREDVAIVRIEQLYPFEKESLKEVLAQYAKMRDVVWVQEEPANAGAWSFLRTQLADILGKEPLYVGRPAMATTAVGSHRLHGQEQKKLISKAFGI
ncbi:MAG: 2-oxoglutarate dehydrogenase E1 component [Desulfuromonas sp.]|nr:MAG: 2-oxoglutarate dehydrogenase E1 component [Desulfuromonas sp.]